MANRLATATSPYLLQHQHNPVDWWEWGEEAFAEARRRNVPVLLSVGYAACHWCHVMAHESFEDEQVAAALAADYVAVKVDREERPDVDTVYMSATTAMTGQGGWPMTCLLTPEGEPFWAGTYLPKPQFLQLLSAAAHAWREREDEVRQGGAHVVSVLRQAQDAPAAEAPADEDGQQRLAQPGLVDPAALRGAAQALTAGEDRRHGGLGSVPKFPPSMALTFLLAHHVRTGDAQPLAVVERAATAMARGGIYDQLAGGFARYSVDAAWVVPHFEKMLYDNALLLRLYARVAVHGGQHTRALAERVTRETAEFLLTDLLTAEGGFASSLDADTEGREGLTYVWTPGQLREVLGAADGGRAAALLSVTPEGTFEHGTSTLQLRADPDDPQWWARTRSRLHAARQERPQPGRDDKVVTAWNGLAVAALAEAGWLLQEPAWVTAAERCARHLLRLHVVDGRLRRSSRDGAVGAAGAVAEDYGNVVEALDVLHAVTTDPGWLRQADQLLRDALDRFGDGSGEFTDVPADGERLVLTPRTRADNAEPSGQSALALALATHGALSGSGELLALARAATDAMAP
ncbi:thioredoxin domain-containing protein, partial [Ornithinicoccus halotolerans]|uniref:thioredoxin domain-containing protein n=1 Tax=Ornithinicoccus halotolerans TaxID=1748220 RepID=UPI0012954105